MRKKFLASVIKALCPGRSAARSTSRSGALLSRGPGYLLLQETGVPVLRSGMKNAASPPGHGRHGTSVKSGLAYEGHGLVEEPCVVSLHRWLLLLLR